MRHNFLEIALTEIARNFKVHPLKPGTKEPLTHHGWKDASGDEAQIREWWTKWPDANVGIACGPSGLCVVDCDHGLTSAEDVAKFLNAAGLPNTYAVRTGRRPEFGVQLYFSGLLPTATWSLHGCSGDIKSLGGYVLAAGCLHPSGEHYEVMCDAPIAPVPDVVRAFKKEKSATATTGEPITENRNVSLISIAGTWRNDGMTEDCLAVALLQHNADWCQPPLEDEEVRRIAYNAAQYPIPERVGEVVISTPAPAPVDWHTHYHTREEVENAPKPEFLIDGFLQRQSIVGIAGFVAHKKSLIALNVCHSLCTGEPLFGKFHVARQAKRVLYLCPEMGLIGFSDRVRKIGLTPYVGTNFFFATMSLQGGVVRLPDLTPEEIDGAVIFVDTAIRFIDGDENSSQHMKELAAMAFTLIRDGAESVVFLCHSSKAMVSSGELTLENAMRGSGELSAFLFSCWATRMQDPEDAYDTPNLLKQVKSRDFESRPFEVTTDRQTCRMTFVEGSEGAVVLGKTKKADADGKEEAAMQVIRNNPDMPQRALASKLKELGIRRSKSWIGDKRYDLLHKGVKAS